MNDSDKKRKKKKEDQIKTNVREKMSGSDKKRKKENATDKPITKEQVERWCRIEGYSLVKSEFLSWGCGCDDPEPCLGVGRCGSSVMMCRNCDPKCIDCGKPVGTDYDPDGEIGTFLCYNCAT